ncbi:MAG: hypothetical protein SGCHY_001349 [Lobulomycetales sp.]
MNGILSVSKTYIAEITDETNQARGFSILGMNKALGLLIGPILGGYLSDPVEKYPWLFADNGFWFDLLSKYPYFLPTMIVATLAFAQTILAYLYLEETLPMDKRMINSSPNPQEEVLIPLLADRDDNFNGSTADGEQDDFNPVDPEDASGETIPAKPSIFMLLKDPSIRYSILMYAIIQSYNFVYDECFALYARLEHSLGGLDWESKHIGMAFSFGGLSLLLFQMFIFYRIERRLGPIKTFRLGVSLLIPCFLVVPRTRWLLVGLDNARQLNQETALIWVLVLACTALRSISSLMAFTSAFILIANGSDAGNRYVISQS